MQHCDRKLGFQHRFYPSVHIKRTWKWTFGVGGICRSDQTRNMVYWVRDQGVRYGFSKGSGSQGRIGWLSLFLPLMVSLICLQLVYLINTLSPRQYCNSWAWWYSPKYTIIQWTSCAMTPCPRRHTRHSHNTLHISEMSDYSFIVERP